MKTYKLGNKVTCVIRAFCAGKIGVEEIKWDKQPYTVLKDVAVDLSFSDITKTLNSRFPVLSNQLNNLTSVSIRNVLLTNKIINLLFDHKKEAWCSGYEEAVSDSEICEEAPKIWLSTQSNNGIYQVFVYDNEGHLESAFDEIQYPYAIEVKRPNSSYLVFYNYPGKLSYDLRRPENLYLTLDFEITGNIDDNTEKAWIHLDKCALKIDNGLSFMTNTNQATLQFDVIDEGNNYITIE